MITKMTFKYFIAWIVLISMLFVYGGVYSYFEGGFENKTLLSFMPFAFAYYIFFGFLGLAGSFILAVGSVGAQTAGNILKDVEKYNASRRK